MSEEKLTSLDWFKLAHSTAMDHIRPWKIALIVTNLLWASALTCLLWFAYFNPAEIAVNQGQDFEGGKQEQTYNKKAGE